MKTDETFSEEYLLLDHSLALELYILKVCDMAFIYFFNC